MGIFSFLSGKGGAGAAEEQQSNGGGQGATAVDAPPAPAVSAESASAAALSRETPAEAGVDDSPASGPSGWDLDTGALTAPVPSTSGAQPQVGPADPAKTAALQGPIIEVIKTVYDPEIPVDIYELGLIYDILVDADSKALVRMTLTSPACPSAQQLPSEVRYKVKAVEGVSDAAVEVVWEPPWDKDRMSEAAKLQLGFF